MRNDEHGLGPTRAKQVFHAREGPVVRKRLEEAAADEMLQKLSGQARVCVIHHSQIDALNFQIHGVAEHDKLEHRQQDHNEKSPGIVDDVQELLARNGPRAFQCSFSHHLVLSGFAGFVSGWRILSRTRAMNTSRMVLR